MNLHPRVVFWQNSASIHQAPLIRALGASIGVEVTVVVPGGVPSERRKMGWDGVDYGDAELIVEPDQSQWTKLAASLKGAHAHVFSGLGAYQGVTAAMDWLSQAASSQATVGHLAVQTESWDPRGLPGMARYLRASVTRKQLTRRVDTFLAIGPLAARQLTRLGARTDRIAQFGYFVDAAQGEAKAITSPRKQIAFVAQLVPRKNPIDFVEAFALLPDLDYRAVIVGDGSLNSQVKDRIFRLGLAERVAIIPRLGNSEVRGLLRDSRLLVLPSKYDGWGTVVNEAITVGTPVAATATCGSSSLLQSPLQGEVIPESARYPIADAMQRALSYPHSSGSLRTWASRAISPEAGARFLWSLINRAGPTSVVPAPWRIPPGRLS